ncbi:unnamed protein product [Rotaria sordida]|uniref:Reverse transcriptase/retrotransposon-derived protein RNase H-like domain-containing protein n=1 Tax=Rotaria sordida TaxID=392033 RepID=A0A815C3J3_9BILA|nr:unnamed protein product [Rotaria sordida]
MLKNKQIRALRSQYSAPVLLIKICDGISINYLGHTISFNGTKPLQDRIEKILSIPQPTYLKQANAFIGAIGWYRKYIKDYAKLAAPILAVTNLITRNKYKFKWDTPKCEASDQLKNILITEPLF